MKPQDVIWARMWFIIALSLLSEVMGIWIPTYSFFQVMMHLFIIGAAAGGLVELRDLRSKHGSI